MYLRNTEDARTFKQWLEKERIVNKGEKAFHIFAPRKTKIKEEINGEEMEKYVITGFTVIPVFALEQTDGKPIDYQALELPKFPLIEKALEWNIDVSAVPGQKDYYGCYLSSRNQEKIRLASPDEVVFFHEISHASHKRVIGKLEDGQHAEQEIVAELSAQVLAQMVGTQVESTLGNSYNYIKSYSDKTGKDIGLACLSVLSQVEKVLHLILDVRKDEN